MTKIKTILTKETYLEYAKFHYNGLRVKNSDNFSVSLRAISRIIKIMDFNKVDNNHQLILNHIIILTNNFGVEPTTNLLLFLIDKKHHQCIITFLVFLGGYDSENIDKILLSKLHLL